MPEACTIEMHFHALAMSVAGDGFNLVLGYYCTVKCILNNDDLGWAAKEV
jgi:hypothetical protein